MLYSLDTVKKPHAFTLVVYLCHLHTLHVQWLIPPAAPSIRIPGKAFEAHLPSRGWPTEFTSCCYLLIWNGAHFKMVLVCMLNLSGVSDSFWPWGLLPARLLCPWDFPGKYTGVGCHFLLQGIFLTQGWNLSLLHLLHWQVDSLPLSHLGSPLIW